MKYAKRGVLGVNSVNVTENTKQKFITLFIKLNRIFHTFSMTNFDTAEVLTGVFSTKNMLLCEKLRKNGYFFANVTENTKQKFITLF